MKLWAHVFGSPVGDLFAAVDGECALGQLHFLGLRNPIDCLDKLQSSGFSIAWSSDALQEVVKQVTEYFARERKIFDLPLRFQGTEFQCRVWKELLEIPYGHTMSYGALATRLGNPKASRAVGRANGSNPIALVVPCHRVIGADLSLTGYGGGVEIKKAFLTLEGQLSAENYLLPF